MARDYAPNQSDSVSVMLLELRRHLASCKDCKNAYQAHDYDAVCKWTKLRIMAIAHRWDANIGMRLRAKRSGDTFTYPCPNLSAHGPAYAMAAEPVLVVGIADRLF